MLARRPAGLIDLTAPAAVAWPLDAVIGANGQFVGLELPRVVGRTGFGELVNPATRPAGVGFDVLVRAARNLAAAVSGLHANNILPGDLNPSNALVGPDGKTAVIDLDSAQVSGPTGLIRCQVVSPEWRPPEQQGVPFGSMDLRPDHDLFALSALVFAAFMDGNHPFAGSPVRGGVAAPVPERIKNGLWPYARQSPYRPRRSPGCRPKSRPCSGSASRPATPRRWPGRLDRVLAGPAGPVVPPAAVAPTVTAPAATTWPAWAPVREWVVRRWEPVRRRPRTATAAAFLTAGLAAGGAWWAVRETKPKGPGGRPTPTLWKHLSEQPR